MSRRAVLRRFAACVAALLLAWTPAAVVAAEAPKPPAPDAATLANSILMSPGQVRTVPARQVQRVAIGNPAVADVTIVSQEQIMIQARSPGVTNLLIWDKIGQHELNITVVDPRPWVIRDEIADLLSRSGLSGVTAELRGDKIFVIGSVSRETDMEMLEQLSAAFPLVINLATFSPPMVSEEAVPMVELSVQVIELNRTDLKRLGVDWTDSIGFTEMPFASRAGEPIPTESLVDTLGESLIKRAGEPFRIGTLFRSGASATINALVQSNKARVLSEPRLVTASGKEASSFIGVEVPILSATSVSSNTASVSASIEFRETGVLLKMTPLVHRPKTDWRITTTVQAEVSSVDTSVGLSVPVGTQTILVPGFRVREANTEVTTLPGETIVIAGLLELTDQKSVNQVPGLGGMPILGRLFRSPETQTQDRELIIAVTPELVLDKGKEAAYRQALERARAITGVTPTSQNPRLRYALNIQERVAKSIHYPEREKGLKLGGTVRIRLHLLSDGTLQEVMLSESSGVDALDIESIKAAEMQAPYPAFPEELPEQELWLEVPVVFRP